MTNVDPVILFFLLGLGARLIQSDLRLPPAIYDFLSVFLLLAIGLKGGVELAKHPVLSMIPGILLVAVMGVVLPLIAYPVLRYVGRFSRPDAGATAAHYGSVSVGTYAVGLAYFASNKIEHESTVTLYLVVLELPAIVLGVLLARGVSKETRWKVVLHEILSGKAIVCLVGGLLIGWLSGGDGIASIEGLFFDLFKGMLALFLLEMGLLCAGQMSVLRRHGFFLIAFGTLMPIASALIGCLWGRLLGLSVGGGALLAVLAASASYIAVPAAMRISVPEANPTLSLSASLGVTFPFNVTIGIPLYVAMAEWFYFL